MLAAALDYAAQRGWLIFPARFVLDDRTGKWGKKSWKSAKSSNGRAWGMTKDLDEVCRDFAKPSRTAVGIPTGAVNNIFVVETDTPAGHNVDGPTSLKLLEAEHGTLPDTLMAESPSKSRHRYFNHPGNGLKVRSTASELGPGIDVRGEGGMVIAPPSVRGDGHYRWLNNNPIADAPQWLIDLVVATSKSDGKGTDDDAEEPQAPIEQIRAAFAVIPNDDLGWEDWNNRGMALFRATAGSDDGLAIFHAWSSKSKKKYNAQRTDDKWAAYQSCPPTEIGVGSIFYWANEASPGWDDEQADDQLGEDDEARRRLLWEFIRTALRDGIDENQIIHACLDEKYRGRATYEHVRDHGGEDYIKRQIERALNYDPLIVRRKRSLIRVEGGKLHELWRAVQRELIDRHCPVYVRGNRLVQPLWRWEKALDGREFLTAQFERYNVPRLADMVAHYAVKFQKFDGRMKRWKDIDPPDNLIEHILEARQWNFRTVVGIINAPTMRADGSCSPRKATILQRSYGSSPPAM